MADSTEAGDALKYFQEGNAHFERGELDAAIQDYRRGLDAAPHHAALHYNLARISQTSTGIACRYSTFESEINVLQLFDLQSKEDSLF